MATNGDEAGPSSAPQQAQQPAEPVPEPVDLAIHPSGIVPKLQVRQPTNSRSFSLKFN